MKISSLLTIFRSPAKAPVEIKHAKGSLKERCIRHLICHSTISTLVIQRMGSTDERNVIYDLRQEGYLLPVSDPNSFKEVGKGRTRYRVHKWSGKVPATWVKSDSYTGRERRSKPRGNQ
jgi:hypothetical protein